ncbi:MAG: hypothetical protein AB7I01_07210 [Gammaproteobacteria bacterium]
MCDDLELAPRADAGFDVTRNGCRRAERGFARAPLAPTPRVAGRESNFETAVKHAARLLRGARQPHFAGLGTDVDGMRAAVDLAERCGASLDHAHGETLAAMNRVLQTRGWYATTLSEVRNRADHIVLIGLDLEQRYENLVSRCLRPAASLEAARREGRRITALGPRPAPAAALPAEHLRCAQEDLVGALHALLGLLKGTAPDARRVGSLALTKLAALAEALRAAQYVTLVFAPGALAAPREPALTLLCELVDELNRGGRAALLPLGGDDGAQTAQSTCAWLTGYPLRLRLGRRLDYQPQALATARVLAQGGADALLWIDAFGTLGTPPAGVSAARSVVLGAAAPDTDCEVFIPVGTPGLDYAARLLRTDAVVSLPLAAQRARDLPAVASVLRALLAEMR